MTKQISQRKLSFISFFTMFVIGTDTFIVAPLLPTLSRNFDVGTEISGWMVSAYALGYTLLALVSGPVSDRTDRRKVLLLGLLGFCVSTALCGFANNFEQMILYRFIAGMSAAFVSPQIWASIPILSKKEQIVRTIGFATAGLSVAQIAGIPIGSYLASLTWSYAFWAISLVSLILLLLLSLAFPSVTSTNNKKVSFLGTYKSVFSNKKLSAYLFGYFLFQVGNFGALSFYGSWLSLDFNFSILQIGNAMMCIGLGNAIGSIYGTKLIPKVGIYQMMLICFVAMSILYLIVPSSINYYMAIFFLSVIMILAGLIFSIFMAVLQAQTENERGTVSSLANASMYLGTTIGGVAGGFLLDRFSGFYGVAYFTVTLYIVSFLVFLRFGAFNFIFKKDSSIVENQGG